MANVAVKHTCGCGFKTDNLAEAVEHCDSRKHVMTVLGTIRPEKATASELELSLGDEYRRKLAVLKASER